MPKYLIEVPHGESTLECNRAIAIFLRTGSHFLSNAEWGCKDGVHKAWFMMEVDTREEARNVVPSEYRPQAKIVQVRTFRLQDVEEALRAHSGK
jgi:hypothetical protein